MNKAYSAALRLLAYKPRTEWELGRKLTKRGFSRAEISLVLARVKELGYVNDEEYARRWAQTAVRDRHYGPLRIKLELQKRGIDREMACRAAEETVSERGEEGLAREIMKSRIKREGVPEDPKGRRRLFGYLSRRGFSRGAILAALRDCGKDKAGKLN